MRPWSLPTALRDKRVHRNLCVLAGAVAALFVTFRVTPSSYGVALGALGIPKKGLIAFAARPVRSDEWAVITPAIQATVNNHYERVNATSFYKEDLRQIYALPVRDWGFVFRPTMWLFGITSPSVAYSAHHVAVQLLFIVGFAMLFRRSGLIGINAWLLSVAVYWSGFVTYFWTTVGPVVAWWPWLTLAIIAVRKSWWALPVVAYLFSCWALSFFYPPLLISLGFVTAVVVFAFRHNRLSLPRLVACGVACVVGAAIALFYLREPLMALNDTFYPGQRRVDGGGFWAERFVSLFLPFAYIAKNEPYGLRASLGETNICELGVVGSVYFLFALLVLAPRRALTRVFSARRSELLILVAACVAVFAWMTLPIPARVGGLLLWDRVPPSRMVMACGLLLALLATHVFRHISTRLTPLRFGTGLVVILAFVVLKSSHGELSFRLINRDIIPAIGLIAVYLARRRMSASLEHSSLLAVATLTNCLCFASFNPLQQADPIFQKPLTSVTRAFDEHERTQHGRPLLDRFPGRVLNGLGYSAIAHVESTPQMRLWRELLPELGEQTLQVTFNRYAHVIITDDIDPSTPQGDVALLPYRLLMPRVESRVRCEGPTPRAGAVTSQELVTDASGVHTVLKGSVPALGVFRDQAFQLVSDRVLTGRSRVSYEEAGGPDLHDFELVIDGELQEQPCVLFVDQHARRAVSIGDSCKRCSTE